VGALVIGVGVAANMFLTYAARASGGKYSSGKSSAGSPLGNAVVTNQLSPNQLWVVIGEENAVQRLLQRPILVDLDRCWGLINIIAGIFGYAYTVFTFLAPQLVTSRVQLIIGGLLMIGMFANMVYTGRYGEHYEKMLSSIAEKDVGLEYKESLEFPNRTSAVAYCVLRCKSDSRNLGDLLPNDTPVWIQWRRLLTHFAKPQIMKYDIEKSREFLEQWQEEEPKIKKIKEDPNDQKLWNRFIKDLLTAKETYLNENEVQVIVEKDDGTGSQMTDADDVETNKLELAAVGMIETPTDTNLE